MTMLSVVIPALNEEDGIGEIILRIQAVEQDIAAVGIEKLEIIVVDDGSVDETPRIAGNINGVKVIQHDRNRGYGAALKSGFSQAKGDFIGFLDADGTYPPEHFPRLCEVALEGTDLVIGSRMAGTKSDMPLVRRIGNKFFAGMISLLGRHRITDSASGMRVFRRDVLEKVYPLPDGLNLTPIMSTRAIHEGVKMAEVPIPYSERVGRSKLSAIRDGSIYLQTITWTVLTYNPVRILGMLGLLGISLSALIGSGIVVARLQGVTYLGHWGVAALFVGLLSGIGGTSLFCLGVTFNYLVSIFYRRPIRQGLFGRPILPIPLEGHFFWLGLVSFLGGLSVGIFALAMGLKGWEITRLWFYLLTSAMLALVGFQLMISWVIVRVLQDLSQRERLAEKDRNGIYHISAG